MTTLSRPRRLNQIETARPGSIGSVGDTLVCSHLATSYPDAPIRFSENYYRNDLGSGVTLQPYVYDSSWNMGRGENTAYGMMQQDLRAPDRLHEPTLGSVPQYQFRNKIATVYQAKRTGNKFLPLPGPYVPALGEMVRGGQVVRTTDIEGLYKVVENQQDSPSVGLARRNDAMFRKQQKLGMNSKKMNNSMSSPIVLNQTKPTLNSRSSSFKLMDPNSLVNSRSGSLDNSSVNPFSFGE